MFQATHLIVFLPPCLGAFVLSNHSSHNSAFFKFSSPDASASEGPTACVKQVANFPLPSLLSNQSDTLTKAPAAAAEGYLSPFTIPLLAEPGCLGSPSRLFEAHAPGWGGGGKGSLVSCKKTDLEKTVERFV